MSLAAAVGTFDVWAFRAHPDVWALVAAIAGGWWWAVHRLGPRLRPGREVVSPRQRLAFWSGLGVMWLASDWPLHDLADSSLYSAHMVQHLLLSLVVPPLLLAGTPTWLARELLRSAGLAGLVRRFGRPVPAAIIFNSVVVVSHWPGFVDLTVQSGLFHFAGHVLLVSAALLMWMPVVGPLPELRIRRTSAMLYLFVQSIIPTVPAAWLTFADGAVYEAYVDLPKAFGASVLGDQQAAGLIMKLLGGFYLWTWITILFFRWAADHERASEGSYRRPDGVPPVPAAAVAAGEGQIGPDDEVLTWQQVARALERSGAPSRESGE